ncbi:cation:proton antiporter [Candidatus Woesearchaeota archaeon]|nr:cation:proton antiporter [Candidatus Woesearchaeota archaeon]
MEVTFTIQLLSTLCICLVSSFLINRLFKKLNLPNIIAPLIVGLALNTELSRNLLSFIPEFEHIVELFANLGIVLTLFFLGLKINLRSMKNLSKNSSIMAINAGFFPFIWGFVAAYLFKYSLVTSFFVGVCLSITAEEVSISILDELKLIRTRIGQLIIEAGAIGNVFEIIVIALLGIIIKSINLSQSFILFKIAMELIFFFSLITIMRYILVPFFFDSLGKTHRNFELFLACFVILILLSLGSELLAFGYIIGALLAGLIVKDHLIDKNGYKDEQRVIEVVETVNFSIFEPMIFIWIGLLINPATLIQSPMFGIVLTVIAILGKLLGAIIGNFFCKESILEGMIIGWGLNARGATELFAVLIAKNIGMIGNEIFNAVVFMALMTTIISPIVFKILVRREEKQKKRLSA